MVFKNKYGKLREENPNLSGWHDHVYNKKSPKSADNMYRNIGLFCEKMNLKPDSILDLSDSGELSEVFEKFVEIMEKDRKMGSYISKYKHAINSFLKYHKRTKKLDTEITNEGKSSKYNGELIPSKLDLQHLFEKSTTRGRVIISLMAFSGLRPESIGNYVGNDGIRLKDLSGLDLSDPTEPKFTDFPIKIMVRDTQNAVTRLSKNGSAYWTMAGHQTMQYILDYLQERIRNGEKLTPESPLIRHSGHGYGKNNTLKERPDTEHIRREIRTSMRRSGITQRPYVLRRYFMQTLSTAELKGFITMEWRLFLSGHSGNIQSTYVNQKEHINPELEKMVKESFVKCLKLLETEHYESVDDKTMLYTALLMTAHFTEEEISRMNLNSLSEIDIIDLIKKRLSDNLNGNSEKYVSVPESDLNDWAKRGYVFKAITQSGLCLMERIS